MSNLSEWTFSNPFSFSALPPSDFPLTSISLLRDFKITEGCTLDISTPATGKPVAVISGPSQGNASQRWAPEAKENTQVTSNDKAYRVVLSGQTEPRIIRAASVSDDMGRLTFYGSVEGFPHSNEVVASLLSTQVEEYGLVALSQDPKEGSYTYRVLLIGGQTQDVVADKVLYSKDKEGSPLFTLVTELGRDCTRIEFTAQGDQVRTITRLSDGADVKVPAQPQDEPAAVPTV